MNLSTSNFKEYLCVVAVVGLAICSFEAFTRLIVLPKSSSYQTIENVAISSKALKDDSKSVVVIGNSFTIRAINENEFSKKLRELNPEIDPYLHAISGSHICEWYWLAKLNYFKNRIQPNFLLLNVGPMSLIDRDEIRHRRLAMIFGSNNKPILPGLALNPKRKNLEFLISRYLMSVNRGRNIGEQFSSAAIPSFQKSKRLLSARTNELASAALDSSNAPDTQFDLLRQFHEECDKGSVRLVIVLMPHMQHYELPPNIKEFLDYNQIPIVDLRTIEGLTDIHFGDAVHLNEAGKKLFTPIYAENLINLVGPH